MTPVLQSHCFNRLCYGRIVLGFSWISGLILGCILFCFSASHVTSLMRGFYFSSVSIVGLFLTVAFPYLITILAVFFSSYFLIFVFSFLKGICFSFISLLLVYTYDYGWLIRLLLMSFEFISIPTLYVCWSRVLVRCNHGSVTECLGWFSFSFLLASIDYRIFSPLISELFIL